MFGPNADLPHALLLHVLSCLDMRSRLRLVSSCRRTQSCSPFATYSEGTGPPDSRAATSRLFDHRWASWRVEGLIAAIERAIHSKHNRLNPDCAAHAIALSSVPIGARFTPSLARALGGRPELPTNLKSLCLRNCGVTHAIVPGLLLHVNGALKNAQLHDNTLGDKGVAALSEALKSNTALATLGLRGNEIGAAGARSLAGMLRVNKSLTSVDISSNSIGDTGTAALGGALARNNTLETLGLAANGIGAAGARSLAGMLQDNRALLSVNLFKNDLGHGAAAVVAAAKQQGKIKTLCGIEENQSKADLTYQYDKEEWEWLRASYVFLLSFDLAFNRSLKSVILDFNNIGDEGAVEISAALENNTTLTQLSLQADKDGVRITAAGAQAIAKMLAVNTALKSANLGQNDIGDQGAIAISAALENTTSALTHLNLQASDRYDARRITAAGARAIAHMLVANRALTSLNLGRNKIGASGAKAIAGSLPHSALTRLVINVKLDIKKLKTHTSVDLEREELRAEEAIIVAKCIALNRALTSVNLLWNDLGDGAQSIVAAAKQHGNIKTLCGINEDETEIDFMGEDLEAEDAVLLSFDLEVNRALTSVNLLGNELGNGAASIVAAAKQHGNIKTLCGINRGKTGGDLSDRNLGVADAVLLSFDLEFNRSLTTLNLASNDIGVPDGWYIEREFDDDYGEILGYKHTDGRSQEKFPQGTSSAVIALAESLKVNSPLKKLILTDDFVGDEGVRALSEGLKANKTLEELHLNGRRQRGHIGPEGAKYIAEMLKVNRSLTSVNLLKNDLGDGAAAIVAAAKQGGNIKTLCGINEGQTEVGLRSNGLKVSDAVLLSFDLEFNRALISVNLLKNDLGDGAAAVVAAAKQQGNIKTLCGIEEGSTEVDFSGSGLKAPDAVLLSFDLEFNRTLKSANLGKTDIGDESAIAISAALESNTSLTELNLSSKGYGAMIGNAGAQAIAKMLVVNRVLISANLGDNGVRDEGAAALSGALKTNITLETLELCYNGIGAAGAQSLAEMLQVNRALTSVNLLENELGDGAAAIVAAAKQNGNIKTLCGIEEGKTAIDLRGSYRNELKAPDAVLLSFDLEFNRSLKSAKLGGNSMGDEGTTALSEALKSNSTLEELELPENGISVAGAQSLANMLQFNRSLKSVHLEYNQIPEEGKQQLRDAANGKGIKLRF